MISISTFNVFLDAEFGVHFPQLIEELFRPLVLASDSLAAVLISILICQLLWFMGIHGALIITGIMNPFWMSNLLENKLRWKLAVRCSLISIYLLFGTFLS